MIRLFKKSLILIFLFIITSSCITLEGVTANEKVPEAQITKPDKVVAQDGSGDFTTVQAAVDAAPSGATQAYVVTIKAGYYKEVITVPEGKDFIHFKGEGADKTILTYDNYSKKLDPAGKEYGTSGSASVFIKADNFTAEDLTFENSAGIDAGQALAINIGGNFSAFRNCRFLGHQDTYYAASNTLQYLKNCYIAGTVDFMFGGSTAFFEGCTLHSLRNGYLTAASTPQESKYGYVFFRCKLTAAPSVSSSSVYLGRPWRPHANVVFLHSNIGAHIRAEGWHNWSKAENERTAKYAEYKSTGEGYKKGARVQWSKELTEVEASEYTKEKVLGNWSPF